MVPLSDGAVQQPLPVCPESGETSASMVPLSDGAVQHSLAVSLMSAICSLLQWCRSQMERFNLSNWLCRLPRALPSASMVPLSDGAVQPQPIWF